MVIIGLISFRVKLLNQSDRGVNFEARPGLRLQRSLQRSPGPLAGLGGLEGDKEGGDLERKEEKGKGKEGERRKGREGGDEKRKRRGRGRGEREGDGPDQVSREIDAPAISKEGRNEYQLCGYIDVTAELEKKSDDVAVFQLVVDLCRRELCRQMDGRLTFL